MSSAASYYSGYGATLGNMNGNNLSKIHKGIKEEFGDEAAENFVAMVAGMEQMKATSFLNELYSLCASGWKYAKTEKDAVNFDVDKNEDGSHNLGATFGCIGQAMLGCDHNDTEAIRGDFLESNGYTPKQNEDGESHRIYSCDGFHYNAPNGEGWEKTPTQE